PGPRRSVTVFPAASCAVTCTANGTLWVTPAGTTTRKRANAPPPMFSTGESELTAPEVARSCTASAVLGVTVNVNSPLSAGAEAGGVPWVLTPSRPRPGGAAPAQDKGTVPGQPREGPAPA